MADQLFIVKSIINTELYRTDAASQKAAIEKAIAERADLRGADLSYANLRGAILSGANLRGADLSYAILSYAILSGANLRGADLSYADLSYANLRGADLSYADLSYANLSGAILSGAILSGARGIAPEGVTPLLMLLDQPGQIRAYKLVNAEMVGPFNGGLVYKIGKRVTVKGANSNVDDHCGAGINVATLDWCLINWKPGFRVLIVEFTAKDIAAIPTATDGKFRLHRCAVVGEKDISALIKPSKGK